MSVAPKLAPDAPPEIVRVTDPLRIAKVRHALHLLVPRVVKKGGEEAVKWGRLTITEMKAGARLSLDQDDDDIGVRFLDLSITELAALSDMLNRIRRHVVERKEWRP